MVFWANFERTITMKKNIVIFSITVLTYIANVGATSTIFDRGKQRGGVLRRALLGLTFDGGGCGGDGRDQRP